VLAEARAVIGDVTIMVCRRQPQMLSPVWWRAFAVDGAQLLLVFARRYWSTADLDRRAWRDHAGGVPVARLD
jgi:hypothetical protein